MAPVMPSDEGGQDIRLPQTQVRSVLRDCGRPSAATRHQRPGSRHALSRSENAASLLYELPEGRYKLQNFTDLRGGRALAFPIDKVA
jgi:hypothetical protein